MFLTITIDSNQVKRPKIRFNKRVFGITKGWHNPIRLKKKSFWEKFISWKRKTANNVYKLGDQAAMF